MSITEGTQPAVLTWTGAWTTNQTTASFTPESGALLVALVSAASVSSGTAATAAVTDSLSGTWTLLLRTNSQGVNIFGTAEVWCRDSPNAAMTVSVHQSAGASGTGGQMTVRTLIGAQATANQPGATGTKSNDSPATVQASVAAGTGNKIYGATMNWDTSTAMTVLGNTTAIAAVVDSTNGDNWASFKSTGDTAGTATYGYSTSVRAQFSAVEIKASAATGGGPAWVNTWPPVPLPSQAVQQSYTW